MPGKCIVALCVVLLLIACLHDTEAIKKAKVIKGLKKFVNEIIIIIILF